VAATSPATPSRPLRAARRSRDDACTSPRHKERGAQTHDAGSAVAAPQTSSSISRGASCPTESGNEPLGPDQRIPDQRILVSAVVRELAVRLPLPVPILAPSFPRNILRKFFTEKQDHAIVISLLDERRCQAPDGKRPHAHRMGKTEGKHQKAGVQETLAARKGWRPSACPRLETASGSFCGRILAGHRIDRPVFFPRTVGFPFRAHRLRGRRVGQIGPSVRDPKNAASPSLRSKRQGRTRNEDQGNDAEIWANGQHRRRPWPPSTGEAAQEIKKCS
jgi:hypothetical protein